MKCLVIIPATMHNYSFSAPLAWMFSKHAGQVQGIYGFQLTGELVNSYNYFIIELNWFIQLAEFETLVKYIKTNNKDAKILFGGLYSSMKYRDIFERNDVDYFIKGDSEVPMEMFLDSVDPKKIPNMVGKDFENPITEIFKEEDYDKLEFNLDWFPAYFEHIEKDQMYQLPMIVTSKGGCSTVHKECDYCMGARHADLEKMYSRPPIVMKNDTLMGLLRKVEKKFQAASVLILSECDYDFSNQYFDMDVNVEIDSPVPVDKIEQILYAFRKCVLNISVYEDGLCGEVVRENYDNIIALEDDNHKIMFFAFDKDAAKLKVPADHVLHAEEVFPTWAHYDYYSDIDKALLFSGMFYYKLEKEKKFYLS